jgi:hypothetical protein
MVGEGRVWVLGFGVRASVGRVAANRSRFPPFDPVEARYAAMRAMGGIA